MVVRHDHNAVLAHMVLKERLHLLGIVGCVLCIVGSTTIVLHAPQERAIESVKDVWVLATEPAFLMYALFVVALVLILIFHYVPQFGNSHVLVYITICSLMGSLSVMSVKALGIAVKLTLQGQNQLIYPQTSVFAMVVLICILTQMNYLNKALDTFNTAIVSPIYYVMFTSLTILASAIMFKDWDQQTAPQIITELCGFITILSGTFLLHATKDMGDAPAGLSSHWSPASSISHRITMNGANSKQRPEDESSEEIPLRRQDSFRIP
uniref:Probable magnesium transporter n=1 Tax=Physcomitrium patens TaxID=3218 RepID=A0A7I4FGC0_PHYPA